MKNVILLLLLGLAAIVVLVGSSRNKGGSSIVSPPDEKIKVAASFYPLYYFAGEIGKDKAEIINLTPSGTEPHDYEPNARDLVKLEQYKMLIVNGAGFEPWVESIGDELTKKNVPVLAVAEKLAIRDIEEEGEMMKDPHVWLDPVLAKDEVTQIKNAFSQINPENKDFYEAAGKQLEDRLDALDQEFQQGLVHCKKKDIVTSHAAFGYLALRYGLNQVALTGLSPDQEPSPSELADITSFAKAHDIKYIFFETLASPRLSETIAREVGAKTIVFDPIEGLTDEDIAAGRDYFSVQRENLKNLKIALACES